MASLAEPRAPASFTAAAWSTVHTFEPELGEYDREWEPLTDADRETFRAIGA